jgi:hypothetical protein
MIHDFISKVLNSRYLLTRPMKGTTFLAGLVVVGLIAGILGGAASHAFAAASPIQEVIKRQAADSLRQTGLNIADNPKIPDPPRNDVAGRFFDRANQLDSSGCIGGCGG